MGNQDLSDYGSLDQMNSVTLYWSKFSGFGKTYQIEKTCQANGCESIEIPLYGETTNQELLQILRNKISKNRNQMRLHLNIYPMNKSQDIHAILF